jgi:DNA-directed RNA polymerase specialized sigma24 family protein
MVEVEDFVARAVAGEGGAFRELQALIQPTIAAIARSHPLLRKKGLAQLPDDVAEITTATLERFARSDFQNLRRFLERRASADEGRATSFDAWLYGAVDFVIREHVRKRFGRAPVVTGTPIRAQPSKRDLNTQAHRLDDVEPDRSFMRTIGMTAKLTVAEIFAHVERDFAADEARALRLYYAEDQDFEQIAEALGLADEKEAQRLIRKLNARLRYHFAEHAREQDEGTREK